MSFLLLMKLTLRIRDSIICFSDIIFKPHFRFMSLFKNNNNNTKHIHALLCMCAKSLQSCLTPCDTVDCMQPPRILCSWDSPGKNTGVGCHALLQGIFLTQGSNLCLLHLRALAGSTTWEAPQNC